MVGEGVSQFVRVVFQALPLIAPFEGRRGQGEAVGVSVEIRSGNQPKNSTIWQA